MKHYHHMTLDICSNMSTFTPQCHVSSAATSTGIYFKLCWSQWDDNAGSHIRSNTLCLWLQSERNDPPHVFLAFLPHDLVPPDQIPSPCHGALVFLGGSPAVRRSAGIPRPSPVIEWYNWSQTDGHRSFQVYLLHVFGPVRRLRHGHEATVGQDGAHDEQTE